MDITAEYGKSGREKCTLLQFRHEVIRGLLEKYAIKRKAVKRGRPSKTDPPIFHNISQPISQQLKRSFPVECLEFVPEERKRGGNLNSAGISHYILKTALKPITQKGNTRFCLYICSNYVY